MTFGGFKEKQKHLNFTDKLLFKHKKFKLLKNFGECALRFCAGVFASLSTRLSIVAYSPSTSGKLELSPFLSFHMQIWSSVRLQSSMLVK